MVSSIRRFGPFELDLSTGELRKRGVRVRLQEQPFRVLEALTAAPGELVERERLKEVLWPEGPAYRTDENLNVAVKRLRRTLDDASSKPRFVETLRNRGYRFVASVELVDVGPAARGRFVARREELSRFRELFGVIRRGTGTLVLVSGEPGIGKSRLAEEVLAAASRLGLATTSGRCYESEATPPFVAVVEAIERASRALEPARLQAVLGESGAELAALVPEIRARVPVPLPVDLPPEARQRYLFNGVVSFFRNLAPLVVVFEDLHCGDAATLALVEHLAAHVATMPALVIGTYRDTEVDERPHFGRLLESLLSRRLAERMAIERLGRDDVSELIRDVDAGASDAFVDRIHELTAGNPFFVEEMVRHIASGGDGTIPENVRLVLGERLKRLGAAPLEALRGAAVLGRDCSLQLLEAMGIEDALESVEIAERARVLRPSPNEREALYAFEHELTRQAILSGLSPSRRQRWHARIAETLERLRDRELDSEIAYHLYQAGALVEPSRLADYLARASEQAMSRVASEEALAHAERGLSLPKLSDEARAGLLHRRGTAKWALRCWPEAVEDWQQAFDLFEALGNGSALTALLAGMNVVLGWAGESEAIVALARRAEAALGPGDARERCRVLCYRAVGVAGLGDDDAANEALDAAETISSRLEDPALECEVAIHGINAGALFADPKIEAFVERALPFLQSSPDLWNLAYVLAYRQLLHIDKGRLDEADSVGEQAQTVAERVGHLGALGMIARSQSHTAWMRTGDLEEYLAFCLRNVEHDRTITSRYGLGLTHLARALFWKGSWEEGLEATREAMRVGTETWGDGAAQGCFVLVAAYAGRPEANEVFERSRALLLAPDRASPTGRWMMLPRVVEGLVVLGRRKEAAQLYPRTLRLLDKGFVQVGWGDALSEKAAAIAATAAERWEDAERHFDSVLRQADDIPYRLEQAEVRRWYAHMLAERDGAGDRGRAASFLEQALGIYQDIGMPRHLELARSMRSDRHNRNEKGDDRRSHI